MLAAIYKSTGQIVRFITATEEVVNKSLLPGESYIPAPSDAPSYVQNGELVPFPAKPSPHHEWDWTTKTWLPNLNAAREAKLQQVAAELSIRLYLPCNGFDADKTSRERISGMIARLQRGDGLPAGWVGWRDASNQQRWATDDAATVLANLVTLSRAIEDREQSLLVASWTHKENITKLQTIEEILQYDVTQNWPT